MTVGANWGPTWGQPFAWKFRPTLHMNKGQHPILIKIGKLRWHDQLSIEQANPSTELTLILQLNFKANSSTENSGQPLMHIGHDDVRFVETSMLWIPRGFHTIGKALCTFPWGIYIMGTLFSDTPIMMWMPLVNCSRYIFHWIHCCIHMLIIRLIIVIM